MDDVSEVVEIHNPNNQVTTKDLEALEAGRNPEETLSQWVIECDGEIAAYADCGNVFATTTEDTFHGWITVHPKYRQKGYGIKLLEECEVFAIKHGMSKLDGGMDEDQPHSIEWMNKRGFKQYGRLN
jgi:N-acetylglutamate synthase-like GNAT family acetyltransferase